MTDAFADLGCQSALASAIASLLLAVVAVFKRIGEQGTEPDRVAADVRDYVFRPRTISTVERLVHNLCGRHLRLRWSACTDRAVARPPRDAIDLASSANPSHEEAFGEVRIVQANAG